MSDVSAPSGLLFRLRREISVWDAKCEEYKESLKEMKSGATATREAITNMRKTLKSAKETRKGLKTLLAQLSAAPL